MFRKILLKSGLLAVIGVAMIGMMSFAKPKDSVCFSAGLWMQLQLRLPYRRQ